MLRLVVRAGSVLTVLVAIYLLITFVQVWNASNRTHEDQTQAIIVLGAAQYDGRPSPVLEARLDHAIELYDAGVSPTIVVTGGKQPGDRFTEAAAGYEFLRRRDIPDAAILREEQGSNTWEQLAAASRFLAERDITRVVLVSDDYHAYRLGRIADELGLVAQVSRSIRICRSPVRSRRWAERPSRSRSGA
ncbi:MAG: YdcF family protein [Acidimicrobiia bacterium]|nr:YdcF family protein [Acidimicrobiia bacterium]